MKRTVQLFAFIISVFCVFTLYPLEVNAENDTIRLPILMYHSVLKYKTGQYIVSTTQLENDLKRLKEEGYETVSPSQLLAYCRGTEALPKKPIMITFDDGLYNNEYYAVKLLEKYSMKAVFNVIGSFSEYSTTSGDHSNPNYSHLTWSQIAELASNENFSIGNHTYFMHDYRPRYGVGKRSGESKEQYIAALTKDFTAMDEALREKSGVKPICFAYPFGKYTTEADEVLDSMGYPVRFTCYEVVNVLSRDCESTLKKLGRFNRDGRYSTDEMLRKIEAN